MKGAVFIAFNEMIETTAGLEVWEQLLQRVQPESGGVYTSVDSYSDDELYALVDALSDITGLPQSELVGKFGHSLFGFLNDKYPQFTAQQPTFFDFIKSIDGTIHKEVNKLYSNANLPKIDCHEISDKELLVRYQSPRKLCVLAEGLIAGAAEYYQLSCTIDHRTCMHRGDDYCDLHLHIA